MIPRRYAIATLSLLLLISAFFVSQLPDLTFDHSITAFYPTESSDRDFFEEYKAEFGNDNDHILISVTPDGSLFDPDFLHQVNLLEEELKAISGIHNTYSPLSIPRPERKAFGRNMALKEWMSVGSPTPEKDSLRLFESGLGPLSFLSKNRDALLILALHDENPDGAASGTISEAVHSVLQGYDFRELHFAGKCLNQSLYVETLELESLLFTSLAGLAIMLLLWFTYRNPAGVLIPITIIGLTVLWTVGLMVWMGESLNLISHILPVILLVIGMSDVIHLRTHYLSQKPTAENRVQVFLYSSRTIGKATVYTSLTTAIGFLTLTTSTFQPVVELGMYASIGLGFALLLTYLVSGSVIALSPSRPVKTNIISGKSLDDQLETLYQWVQGHPKQILVASLVLCCMGVSGSLQIKVNNYLLDELKPDHPHQQDFRYFADQYGGARPVEIQITAPDGDTLFTVEHLQEIAEVSDFLQRNWGADIFLSPDLIFTTANQIYGFGRKSFQRLPQTQDRIDELMIGIMDSDFTIQERTWLTEDRLASRIQARMEDVGSHQMEIFNAQFESFVQDSLPSRRLAYQITGTAYLMDQNSSSLAENVLIGLAIALIFIGILFSVLMKSWRMVMISIIVNVFPLLVMAGIMGWAGIDLKISTSFVFVVAFGIAVDDSIHFLARLRQELQLHPVETAVRNSFLHSGKAILLTTIILLGGFMTFCLSDFLGTFYFGVLISSTLLLALLADLFLLPVLILTFIPTSDTI